LYINKNTKIFKKGGSVKNLLRVVVAFMNDYIEISKKIEKLGRIEAVDTVDLNNECGCSSHLIPFSFTKIYSETEKNMMDDLIKQRRKLRKRFSSFFVEALRRA